MKTLIWKELRENARWAVLCFLGLLIAELFALSRYGKTPPHSNEGFLLVSGTFLMVTTFGCAAVGVVFGCVQFLPELRRDQWAMLLHRPVPRSTILLGKLAAGTLLYLLATGLPLLVSVIHVATPGHFAAPFTLAMVAPAVSDVLLGLAGYLAAVLLALQPGRWLGQRGAIALGVLAVAILQQMGNAPFLLPLFAIAVLLAASWGAISGSIKERPWWARFALLVLVLCGLSAVLPLFSIAASFVSRTRDSTSRYAYYSPDFQIASDGKVFLLRANEGGPPTLTDPEGRTVTDEQYLNGDRSGLFLYASYMADRGFALQRFLYQPSVRSIFRYATAANSVHDGAEIWYQLRRPQNYFIGFDKLSGRCVGLCDLEGFKDPGAVPRPFADEMATDFGIGRGHPMVFWIGPKAYSIDFSERRLTLLLNAGAGRIFGASQFPYFGESSRIAISVDDEIRILDPKGAPLFTVPYGHDPALAPVLRITALRDFSSMYLQYAPPFSLTANDPPGTNYLDVIDQHGTRTATYEMPLPKPRPVPLPWTERMVRGLSPAVPSIIATWRTRGKKEASVPYPAALVANDGLTNHELVVVLTVTVLLTAAAGWRARALGLSRSQTITWLSLTVALGAIGFFGYRLATEWPALVRCPHCSRRRPVRDETCPHCHEKWASAPASGTEIFEPA